MSISTPNPRSGFHPFSARLRDFWRTHADRREHDVALRDPRIADEHRVASSLAESRGEPGCAFCR
jgi:hypothetical protein